MERELRKARSDLKLCGVGAMIFGVWVFLKSILYGLFARDYLSMLMSLKDVDLSKREITALLIYIISFFMMLPQLYVGWRAVYEAKGGVKRRSFYLIIAALILIADAALIPADIIGEIDTTPPFDIVCGLVFEVMKLVNLALLLAAAYKVRKLSAKNGEEAAPDAD